MRNKMNKGFTLVELMIVVAIMAILAAVSAPRFGDQIKKARDAKGLSVVSTWRSAVNIFYADKYEFADNYGEMSPYVDAGTLAVTLESASDTGTAVSSTTSQSAAYIKVGTSTGTNSNVDTYIELTYSGSSSSTDGSISITDSGNDTKAEAWANK